MLVSIAMAHEPTLPRKVDPEFSSRRTPRSGTPCASRTSRPGPRLLARQIARTRPDLIGLQEVALWRRGAQGVSDGSQTPATQTVYDFLRTLRRALARRGLSYRVGGVQNEADVEARRATAMTCGSTMRDAILVKRRAGLRILDRSGANFNTRFAVPSPAGVYQVVRGSVAADIELARSGSSVS